MTRSLTAISLILMLVVGLFGTRANAYSCSKNHYKWTHEQAIQHPLEVYERLAQRNQKTLHLGELSFIRTDLQTAKEKVEEIMKDKSKPWIKEMDILLKDNVPYKKVLQFYARLTLELQKHFEYSEASDTLGFMSTLQTFNEFVNNAHSHKPGGLPVIIIPVLRDLSMGDFVRTNGVPLYYAGVTFNPRTAGDGVIFGVADFFIHDLQHADWMSLFLRNTINDLREKNPSLVPIELARQWNQLANERLSPENEQPLFIQMHEAAEVIR